VNRLKRLEARLVTFLLKHAAHVLPQERRHWADAMRAEAEHADHELSWAAGCVLASYKMRSNSIMNKNILPVSPWILAMEALVGFGPLTLLWVVAIVFLVSRGTTDGVAVGTLLATLAPVALVAAIRSLFSGKPSRQLFMALAIGFAVLGLLQCVSMAFDSRGSFAWFRYDWQLIVLFSVLPCAACLHFSQVSGNRKEVAITR
jgi:hypothetical protein